MKEPCNMPTEVYSRVVGYFRPVQNWNVGKKEEFKDRKTFLADTPTNKPASEIKKDAEI